MDFAAPDPRRLGTIWMRDLDEPAPAVVPSVEARFRRVEPATLPALAAAMPEEDPREILERFAAGRQCYAAWVGEQIAAFGWVSFNEEYVGELRLRLSLLPGEAYIWNCVTLTPFRNFHLYSALLVYIAEMLRGGPFCRVWIGADLENTISQRGMARAGFQHVADLVVARVLAVRQV
jgi:hypothetical protein